MSPAPAKKPPKRDKEAETPYTDESGAGKTVDRDKENETPYTENS